MSKLKISYRNNQINIKSRLDRSEDVSERELQVFYEKLIRGLMRPKVEGAKKISYIAPNGIGLKKYLQKGISKNDFFLVFAQIIEVTKRIDRYGLNINNLVLNLQYTFINELTKELYFIYQPISSKNIYTSIFSYLYDVIHASTFQLQENTGFINDLTDFMHQLPAYLPERLENYIMGVYPEVYRQIQREKAGQSQALNNRKWDKGYSGEYQKSPPPGSENTTVLEEEGTTILEEEGTTVLEEEGTTVLEEEGTTVLNSQQILRAYLLRLSNFDRIDINKPAFRIGKEKSYVDYFVANNNAVSRLHADIIQRGESYYLRDNNSTNHTFVNGNMIEANQEREIFDGDALMLANEAFEFHIN